MLQLTLNERTSHAVAEDKDGWKLDGAPQDWSAQFLPNGLVSVLHKGKSYTAIIETVDTDNKEVVLQVNGKRQRVSVQEPIDQLLKRMGMNLKAGNKVDQIKAPMPGMVLKVLVTPGQQIEKGDGLIVLEAMKMENILKAPAAATVKEIRVSEKTAVEKGTVLIDLA